MVEFDTAMLGLMFEAEGVLAEAGFARFAEISELECCMTESSITVRSRCSPDQLGSALGVWWKERGMVVDSFDSETGRLILIRKEKRNEVHAMRPGE